MNGPHPGGRCFVVGGHRRSVGKTALTVALVRALELRPVATMKVSAHRHGGGHHHVDSLASHLRDTTSAASRRLYEEALIEMTNSGYVVFSEARRVALSAPP